MYLFVGYSVSSGSFNDQQSEWVVAGAPRYNDVGKVCKHGRLFHFYIIYEFDIVKYLCCFSETP